MSDYETIRRDIDRRWRGVHQQLIAHIESDGRLAVVKAPPGSGKTRLLIDVVVHLRRARYRIAVACQTNAQANDVCQRLARLPGVAVIRFASHGADPIDLGPSVTWMSATNDLPPGPCIVVGTTAKWGLVHLHDPFDVLLIDEAWQMAWKDFMLCGQVAERFVLIGDPGQIPPVITLDVSRWETSPRPPHVSAPDVIAADGRIDFLPLSLPASRRLPHDAVRLIRPFYDFDFESYSAPRERAVIVDRGGNAAHDRAIDLLRAGSVVGVTLPTPSSGPPLEKDDEIARVTVEVVRRVLARRPRLKFNGSELPLEPANIGISSTHRAMNMAIDLALPSSLRGRIKVDTAERWQGLERGLMIVVHPLSGVVSPSTFDLETGRLCVMTSRHQCGLVVVTRDHLRDTLRGFIPSAAQAVGKPDVAGRGHDVHSGVWRTLEEQGRVVATPAA
jgi:hypothetical protein